MRIAIVDYKVGNHFSVSRCLRSLGYEPIITHDPKKLAEADKILLPGVGHFAKAMESLHELQLVEVLHELVFINGKPVLGICLGMQILMEASEEAPGVAGLGWIKGQVQKWRPSDAFRYKVPHIGWAALQRNNPQHPLWKDITATDRMYFTHSYVCVPQEKEAILCRAEYGGSFVCGIGQDHITGFQFHPEKSHSAGRQLLKNYLEWPL